MANLIADHKRGDTWNGISFLVEELQEDGTTHLPVNLTGVQVLAQFKTGQNSSSVAFQFNTEDNTITIPNPSNGELFLMPRKINNIAQTYLFDVQLTFPDGTVETIVSDKWTIINDISR